MQVNKISYTGLNHFQSYTGKENIIKSLQKQIQEKQRNIFIMSTEKCALSRQVGITFLLWTIKRRKILRIESA